MARCELIDDLIPLILEAGHHWWPTDLFNLALVSPSWSSHTRKPLYSHPRLHSFSSIHLLARSLHENSSLLPLLTGLCLRPVLPETINRKSSVQGMSALGFLLRVEALRSITLGGELAINAERFLRLLAWPEHIEGIHIDGSLLCNRLAMRPSIEWDEGMALQFPNIKTLRFTDLQLDIVPPSLPYSLPISCLILEGVEFDGGDLPDLLNGTQTLKQLHVSTKDGPIFDEQIRMVLEVCSVDCLHYQVQTDSHSDQFVLDLDSTHTRSIRCLHLDGLVVDLGALNTLQRVCRDLVELVVAGRMVRVTSREWEEMIGCGGFGSLRRLGLPWGTNTPRFTWWPREDAKKVEDATELRDIMLIK